MQHLILWDKDMHGSHGEDTTLPWHDIRRLETYLRDELGIQQGTLVVRVARPWEPTDALQLRRLHGASLLHRALQTTVNGVTALVSACGAGERGQRGL